MNIQKTIPDSFNNAIFPIDMEHNSALCNCFSNLSLDSASFSSPALTEEAPLHLENGRLALGTTHPNGARVVTESNSNCVACVQDMDCSASTSALDRPELTETSNEALSGYITPSTLVPSAKSVELDWHIIQRIANRRVVIFQAVAEGRVSADLFSALDEDSDS